MIYFLHNKKTKTIVVTKISRGNTPNGKTVRTIVCVQGHIPAIEI